MNEKVWGEVLTELVTKEGVSRKNGKPYRMLFLRVHTEQFGPVDVLLDTNRDRAGIVLDMVTRKEA